jgi:hypothetical protein
MDRTTQLKCVSRLSARPLLSFCDTGPGGRRRVWRQRDDNFTRGEFQYNKVRTHPFLARDRGLDFESAKCNGTSSAQRLTCMVSSTYAQALLNCNGLFNRRASSIQMSRRGSSSRIPSMLCLFRARRRGSCSRAQTLRLTRTTRVAYKETDRCFPLLNVSAFAKTAPLQIWWNYFSMPNITREDGDGRPIALTVFNATRGNVSNFNIIAPPFWCNAVAESEDIVYDGMVCNATNTNAAFFGQKCGRRNQSSGCIR